MADAPTTSNTQSSAPTRRPSSSAEGSIKDTIDSILVAFILAFIFRSYVVEAFVIPTGSMAPTLLGAHMRYRCTDCDYRWEVNVSTDGENIPSFLKGTAHGIVCANCGKPVPKTLAGFRDQDATTPSVHHGDRILVQKYAYLLNEPQRGDVIVFKSPDDPMHANEPYYMQHFIKRLVGLPNETVMILDGDVYIKKGPADGPNPYLIDRKNEIAQSAMWRIVYDNDYLPKSVRKDWRQPWTVESPGNGWSVTSADGQASRAFTFENTAGTGWIKFDRTAIRNTHPLMDWLAYDKQYEDGNPDDWDSDLEKLREHHQNIVDDLKLSCTYERISGDGPLRLVLTKNNDTFTAVFTPGAVKLVHRNASGQEKTQEASIRGDGAASIRIDFANVDYKASIRINGDKVLEYAYDPDIQALTNAHYRNLAEKKFPTIQIGAELQTCRLSHISLWRDIYYTNQGGGIRWGKPEQPVELGPDEYFVLGDNSPISKDARFWNHFESLPDQDLEIRGGRVPGRFVLGKAFFVYWPAGYRPAEGWPGIYPNFGDMRFIH